MSRNRLPKLLALLFLVIPTTTKADQYGDFTYSTDGINATITGYTGSNGVVMIPSTIASLPVNSIGDWAFYATSVTNIFIPDSVTNIGDGAFFDCVSLTNVTLGSSVTSIGNWTFGFCTSLVSVSCRGNAPNLGGSDVFYGNAATIYYLPGATNWGPMFDAHPAILWNPPVPLTYTTNSDGITLTITGYTGSGGSVTIPSNIKFLPVTTIGKAAFLSCLSLTGVTIPNTVTGIEDDAFENCMFLTNVVVPDSVTNLGIAVFWGCYDLADAALPNDIKNFGDFAFYLCGSLTNLIIPNGVTNIGQSAFYGCASLVSITIPDSVISIGNNAFSGCMNLPSISIPKNVTSIDYNAFVGCSSLTSIIIPYGVTSIGPLFGGCTSLTNVAIPSSVISIGGYTFRECYSLTNITIPASVTQLGDYLFLNCTNPTSLFFQGNAPFVNDSDVFSDNTNVTVYYLPGTTGWDEFAAQTGVPVVLWNPQVQTSDGSFGVGTNGFGFNIAETTNIPIVVEAATNLAGAPWTELQSCTLTNGLIYFSDPQWTNYPTRFYRIRSP